MHEARLNAVDGPASTADCDSALSHAVLPGLLDAALRHSEPAAVLSAVASWWSDQLQPGRVALAISPEALHPGLIAVAAGGAPTRTEVVEPCRDRAAVSLREVVGRGFDQPHRVAWYPLGDHGRIYGGLAVESPSAAAVPSLWIDLTARLLAGALHRDHRLRDEKLASLAEFAAGAGHEINNPLGTILGRVQLLARDEPDPERLRSLATIGAQALRVRDMIGDLMLFARPPEPQLERVVWAEVVASAAERCEPEWRQRRITLAGDRDPQAVIRADRTQAAVVIEELLRNATRAAPEGTAITINIRPESPDAQHSAVLEIMDEGCGLSATDQRHLFDPFYSGRQAGRGLGFGLTKCWRIVTGHGGCIHAENLSPGLRMTVHWPTA